MAISASLKNAILAIPEDGFWKSSAEDSFLDAGALLTEKGLAEDEIVDLLNDLYYAAASCYGG